MGDLKENCSSFGTDEAASQFTLRFLVPFQEEIVPIKSRIIKTKQKQNKTKQSKKTKKTKNKHTHTHTKKKTVE